MWTPYKQKKIRPFSRFWYVLYGFVWFMCMILIASSSNSVGFQFGALLFFLISFVLISTGIAALTNRGYRERYNLTDIHAMKELRGTAIATVYAVEMFILGVVGYLTFITSSGSFDVNLGLADLLVGLLSWLGILAVIVINWRMNNWGEMYENADDKTWKKARLHGFLEGLGYAFLILLVVVAVSYVIGRVTDKK